MITETEESLRLIYIEGFFWSGFKPGRISFGWKGLPAGIHFTFSFEERADNINIHVTNENGEIDKPKLYLLKIPSKDADFVLQIVFKGILSLFLIPVTEEILKNKNELAFLPNSELEDLELGNFLLEEIKSAFDGAYKIKKGRLRIKKGFESNIGKFAEGNKLLEKVAERITDIPEMDVAQVSGGIILSEAGSYPVMQIGKSWFKFREIVDNKNILTAIMGEEKGKSYLEYIKCSITRVKNAKTRQDVLQYDKPLILRRTL